MIPNCEGCEYEFDEACRCVQEEGLHVATSKDWPGSERIGIRGHFALVLVDDDGNLMLW